MQIWHKKVTFSLPMAWLMKEQEYDCFLLCHTEGIIISDAQFAFLSPEKKKGLISSYLRPYTKETCWVGFT